MIRRMELFCIYLVIVAILAIIYIFVLEKTKEGFQNTFQFEPKTINTNDYLFPTKDLQAICQKEGLAPAYGPSDCVKNGEYVPYANCKCKDPKTGVCQICYPNIKRDERSASIIYQANKF